MSNCIQCDKELRCLSDNVLVDLTEEELDKYLNCDESVFKLNQVEGQQTHPKRICLYVTPEREYETT